MYENLMEEVVSPENYGKALKAVIANQGAPGIDGMKTEELNGHLLRNSFPRPFNSASYAAGFSSIGTSL